MRLGTTTAKDKVTGFAGTVTAKAEYSTGEIRYCIEPYFGTTHGAPEGRWFDESRLEFGEEDE